MPRPLRIEVAGGIYHVIARGNERKDVFRDDVDREFYLRKLVDCRSRFGFFIYAYCLMDNHVHLAIERGAVALSCIMQALLSSHAQRFNKRHDRVGHLFQGRYKAFLVEKERYLLSLLRYIHLNPVQAGVVREPSSYAWSSDRYYRLGLGPEWLDLDRVQRLMARRRSAAVARYRRLMDGPAAAPYEQIPAVSTVIKGDEDFAGRFLVEAGEPVLRKSAWTLESLVATVASAQAQSVAELRRRGQSPAPSRTRSVAAYLGRRLAGIPVAHMARYFGREDSTLQRGVLRLEAAMARDGALRQRIEELAAALEAKSTGVQG